MNETRLVFTKSGDLRFISHLDVNRAFSRAISRAGLAVWRTEGFNTHIHLDFAAPLSLGVASERELVDIRLLEDIQSDALCETLSLCLPEGMTVLSAYPAAEPFKNISYAEYSILFRGDAERITDFFEQAEIFCEKKTKSGIKTVDIRPHIASYKISCGELTVVLATGVQENLNPMLLSKELSLASGAEVLLITRKNLLKKDFSHFE